MADIADVYRSQQNPQFNPLQVLDLAQRGSDLAGSSAIGNALSGATSPNGSVDVDKATAALGAAAGQNPLAGKAILPHMIALQQLKAAGLENDVKAVERYQRRWGLIDAVIYPLISKEDLKSSDVTNAAANLSSHPDAAALGITTPMITNALGTMPRDPKTGKLLEGRELRNWIARTHGQVTSAAEAMHAFSPRFGYHDVGGELRPVDENSLTNPNPRALPKGLPPTAETVGPQGEKQYIGEQPSATPPAGFNAPRGAPGVPQASRAPGSAGGPPAAASLPPGEAEVLAASAKRASDLQASGATSAQYHADLENLKQDSKILDNLGGPTTEVEKKLNSLTQRLGGFGVTMTADQLRAADSFDKIANQVSLNQSKNFHGSDAGLHTVVAANPNLGMTRYSRDGVIDLLQGNQDALDVTRKLWMDARAKGAPAHSYDSFQNELSKVLDPRVFQFNRLSRDNQVKFWEAMEPEDRAEFKAKYQDAVARKWVKPLKAQPAQPAPVVPPLPPPSSAPAQSANALQR